MTIEPKIAPQTLVLVREEAFNKSSGAIATRVLLPNHPKGMVAPCLWHGEGKLYPASLGNIRTIAKN
jgi:hypothetical protein